MKITRERLVELLNYDADTGLFTWASPPKNHGRLKNVEAGCASTGYVLIKIDGKKHKAHRIAWLYVHGNWPEGDIDHINGNPLDNRISNLRLASNPQNQANRRRNSGKVTPKGVRVLPSGRFNARISVSRRLINIGVFDTEDEASAAYMKAAKENYQFARQD